jgi:hypothetical protein
MKPLPDDDAINAFSDAVDEALTELREKLEDALPEAIKAREGGGIKRVVVILESGDHGLTSTALYPPDDEHRHFHLTLGVAAMLAPSCPDAKEFLAGDSNFEDVHGNPSI